jgi:hypothetical protein
MNLTSCSWYVRLSEQSRQDLDEVVARIETGKVSFRDIWELSAVARRVDGDLQAERALDSLIRRVRRMMGQPKADDAASRAPTDLIEIPT